MSTPPKRRTSTVVLDLEDQFSLADNSEAEALEGVRQPPPSHETNGEDSKPRDETGGDFRDEFAEQRRQNTTTQLGNTMSDLTNKVCKRRESNNAAKGKRTRRGSSASRSVQRNPSRQSSDGSEKRAQRRRASSLRQDEAFNKRPRQRQLQPIVGAFNVIETPEEISLSTPSISGPPPVDENGAALVHIATARVVDDDASSKMTNIQEPRAELVDVEMPQRQQSSSSSPHPLVQAKPVVENKRSWWCIALVLLALLLLIISVSSLTAFAVGSKGQQTEISNTVPVTTPGETSDDGDNSITDDLDEDDPIVTPSVAPTMAPTDTINNGRTMVPTPSRTASPTRTGEVYPSFEWIQVGQDLTMTGSPVVSEFGSSVALSGNGAVLAAGSPLAGAINVYDLTSVDGRSGTGWTLREGLEAKGTRTSFGTTVALSRDGTRLATSNPNLGNINPGKGRVLDWRNGSYRELQIGNETINKIPGTVFDDTFGELGELESNEFAYDVAMTPSASTLAMGARRTCLVRVVRLLARNWEALPPVACHGDFSFGWSVDLDASGTTLVVGSPEPGDAFFGGASDSLTPRSTGRSHVFRLSGNEWLPLGSPLVGNALGDEFGWKVRMSENGRVLAVGAPSADTYSGVVYVYEWDDALSDWYLKGSPLDGSASKTQMFGRSLSLSPDGSAIAVGSLTNAQVYRYNDNGVGDWEQIGQSIEAPHSVLTHVGVVVHLLEGRLSVGFPSQATTQAGVVRTYDLTPLDEEDI
eukprot:CAMPEP_0194027632 /NCGR_PEP_ID=MMETSP0009_2-20130614/1761_1 /TAXON_ID=210454 /ORGANISM="Grammatophora oceanica, Strain CCMP 410" /LENGTH=753 /DNA_ID=CAMNT_0038666773 /DNA_START=127 /DNA_END=2388 /DNA_ORIENTATION=+